MFYYCLRALIVALCISSETVIANVDHQSSSDSRLNISRYTTTTITPTDSQRHLLSVIIQLRFPERISTVGEAIDYALRNSGYRITTHHVDDSQYVLFALPLPEVHRQLGPMTLKDALNVLANDGFELRVNSVKRLIHFQLAQNALETLKPDEITKAASQWRLRLKQLSKHHYYGPVNSGESLSTIARRLSLPDATIDQVVVALFLANPKVFTDNNMNWLHQGVMLVVPNNESIQAYSNMEAMQIVTEHEQRWQQQKGGAL